jgi:hypothetical protein
LSYIELRAFLSLSFSYDYGAVDRNGFESPPHRIRRSFARRPFVSPSYEAGTGERGGFGNSNQFQRDVAIHSHAYGEI